MGKNNSSETRVNPLGQAIIRNHALLDRLIQLVDNSVDISIGSFKDNDVYFTNKEDGRKEKSLPATSQHLLSILDLIETNEPFRNAIRKKAIQASKKKDRALLFELDLATFKRAREIVTEHKKSQQQKWAYFEGESRPDLFVENDNFILLIEGKRTEANTTNEVSYLENRSQMVRHIENALDYSHNKKRIIAFYIIDEGCTYQEHCTKKALIKDLCEETIRKPDEINNSIANSFYGYTTWQEIEKMLKIQFT